MAEGAVPVGPGLTEEESFTPQPVEALPDVPGAVSTRPDVLAARASAVATREQLAVEVDRLRSSARATFDLRARIRGIPDRAREDPGRAAMTAAATVGALFGVAALVSRARRRKPYGLLPEDIEAALGKLGKDRDAMRQTVENSFAAYLREHGAYQPSRRRRVPSALPIVLAPVLGTLAREALKRALARPPRPHDS